MADYNEKKFFNARINDIGKKMANTLKLVKRKKHLKLIEF